RTIGEHETGADPRRHEMSPRREDVDVRPWMETSWIRNETSDELRRPPGGAGDTGPIITAEAELANPRFEAPERRGGGQALTPTRTPRGASSPPLRSARASRSRRPR